jgi:hypothetical protein
MGTWGHGLFDDDLALDVKASFDRAVASGASAAEAAAGLMESELAREVLEEFSEADRDDTFWEENRGLFYAIASLQLEHGVLQEVVRQQALQAIAVERRGLDPEQDRARWELLDALEAELSRAGEAAEAPGGAAPEEAPPPRHLLAEGTNPALHIGVTMAKKPPKKPAKKRAKKPAAKKPAAKKPPKKPAKKPAAKKPPKNRRRPARRMA